jgi:hypothetical protein
VVSIDDFFERFNAKPKTNYQKYFQNSFGKTPSRVELILSLFNHKEINNIKFSYLDRFFKEVSADDCKQLLLYEDDNWFAELNCNLIYENKPCQLKLVLKTHRSISNSFSWQIVGAHSTMLEYNQSVTDSSIMNVKFPVWSAEEKLTPMQFLSPVAHALEFSEIDKIFEQNPTNTFFFSGQNPSNELKKLFILLQQKKLRFKNIQSISYHLLQLDGWILKIDRFVRNDINSGWLISHLDNTTFEEKNEYKRKKLNIN